MICNCGSSTESIHKVQRENEIVGEYQKCPACGRILWLWQAASLKAEIEADKRSDAHIKSHPKSRMY